VREDWHTRSPEDVLAQLGASVSGLSAADAAQRLATNGPNELKESKGVSPLQMFLGQFKSLIIWILVAAGGIAAVLGEVVDAVAILAIVVFNAAIGFYQEFNAKVDRGAQEDDGATGKGTTRRVDRVDSCLADRRRRRACAGGRGPDRG
jgi:magnesium-transporting ATPase (P-type)